MTVASSRRSRRPAAVGSTILGIWGVLCLLFLFFPVFVIVVYSFNSGRILQSFAGFGFDAYISAFNSPAIVNAIRVSLVAATGTAVASTILGTLAGIAMARRGGKWAPWLLVLLGVVIVTPEIVVAISLLPWFVTLGVDWNMSVFNVGQVRLVVSHSLFAAAVVTIIVRSRMAGTDESLEQAAADLYAPPWRRFLNVTLPVIRPAVIAGALLSFTFSLDNTVVSSFVSVAGATPWPVYVFSSVRSGLRPDIAAMATVMLIFTLAVLGVIFAVLRRDPQAGKKSGGSALASTLMN